MIKPKILSWSPQEGAISMNWAVPSTDDPIVAADRCVQLSKDGNIPALFLFTAMTQASVWKDSIQQMVINGKFNVDEQKIWSYEFFAHIARKGIKVDHVVLDFENSISRWVLSQEQMNSVFDDPSIKKKLPQVLQKYTSADFVMWSANFWQAFIDWNQYAYNFVCNAIKESVSDPAKNIFGASTIVSNFYTVPKNQIDLNGWPPPTPMIKQDVYSPVCYLSIGNVISNPNFKKAPLWNALISDINSIRGCVNSYLPCVPWISSANFRGDSRYWQALVQHAAACGVNTFLLWNPPDAGGGDDIMKQTFSTLMSNDRRRILPPIPYDADEIITGPIITKEIK
jgi:hypothetical protein